MKKRLIAAALTIGCMTQAQAGIPVSIVLDAPAMMNQVQNYAQMLKEYATMVQQLDEMKRQFSQMEKEFETITGVGLK
ncbi:hypothetical protein D0D70_23985 [Vibrio parahaemolyticus]|nr:hypothetical protein [Vibrio parahaemolyticus]